MGRHCLFHEQSGTEFPFQFFLQSFWFLSEQYRHYRYLCVQSSHREPYRYLYLTSRHMDLFPARCSL